VLLRSRSSRLAAGALGVAALVAATAAQPAAAGPKDGHGSTAAGRVFAVNPVQATGNQGLADNKDADGPLFTPAYRNVMLTDLDGSGYLSGTWANVRNATGDQAFSTTGSYEYGRSDGRFEQVMAYFWVTEAQKYIQSLGFTGAPGALRAVNRESQDVRINQWGQDNSYSWDKHDVIRLGKGGVDDAEDAEVIVHEYGHAVHDSQVVGFGTSVDAGAIGEAFGDYLAVTVGLRVADDLRWPLAADPGCVADWDAVSYTAAPHCLRSINTTKTAENRTGAIHHDGQIWSGALWDFRQAMGAEKTKLVDRIVIDAQFDFPADTSWMTAALATVAAAKRHGGPEAEDKARSAFMGRKIL